MAEADGLLAHPYGFPAMNCPLVQVIPFPFISKRTHLLWTSEREIRGQGTEERRYIALVKVFGHILKTNNIDLNF